MIKIEKTLGYLVAILIFFLISGCFRAASETEKVEDNARFISKNDINDVNPVELDPLELERLKTNGEYLVNIAACGSCHSVDGSMAAPLSGGRTLYDEYGAIVVPNITPDKNTGIGNWTVGEIKRAVRENISKSGRLLSPFSHSTYRWISDEDSKSIALYLQSIKPHENRVEPRVLSSFKLKKWGLLSRHSEITGYVPKMAEASGAYRGLYLVSFVQSCSRCHSPEQKMADKSDFLNGYKGNLYYSESKDFKTEVPSLRNSASGLKNWSEEMIVNYLNKTQAKDSICPTAFYSKMSTNDKNAVASFLKSLIN